MYDFFPPTNRFYFFFLASKPLVRYMWTMMFLMVAGSCWYLLVYAKIEKAYVQCDHLYQNQCSLEKKINVLEKEQVAKQRTIAALEKQYKQLMQHSGNGSENIFSLLHNAVECNLIISSYANVRETQQANSKKKTLALSLQGSFENMQKFISYLDRYFVYIDCMHLKADNENIKMDLRLHIVELNDAL